MNQLSSFGTVTDEVIAVVPDVTREITPRLAFVDSLIAKEMNQLSSFATVTDEELIDVIPDVTPAIAPRLSLADSLVAKEMNQLSAEDRDNVYYDVHGVSDEIEETPVMINESLSQLEVELRNLKSKEAYESAKLMDQEYVQDRDFRLKFLRADRFNAREAALRLARHFQAKLQLFGRSKLVKDIVQDDLDEEDMEALYAGFAQQLPVRDRAGRNVIFWVPHRQHRLIKTKAKVSS
jgi:hypothetical protein